MRESPRNVFLLTADALRADVFFELADGLPDFVRGVSYTDAVATASATAHSCPALAAGVYMDRTGYGLPPDEYSTLAEELTGAGYSCGLWADNHLLGPEYNYDRGFEGRVNDGRNWKNRIQLLVQRIPSQRFFDFSKGAYFSLVKPALGAVTPESTHYTDAESINDSVLEWLGPSAAEDRFVWAHYMDTHHPFEPPEDYLRAESFTRPRSRNELSRLSSDLVISNQGSQFTDDDLRDAWTAYVASCKYWMDTTSEFLETLRERGHFDPERDLLVLTADHGEGFDPGRHEMVGHTPTPSFWEDVVRVPLVICDPEWSERTITDQVSLIDLVPTILDRASGSVPGHVDGEPASDPEDLVRQYAYFTAKGPEMYYHGIRGPEAKLFADRINRAVGSDQMNAREDDVSRVMLTARSDDGESVLFTRDVDSDRTPTEHAGVFDRLHAAFTENHRPALVTESSGSVSRDVEEHLESLGYLDDVSGD